MQYQKKLGFHGEQVVMNYLKQEGFTILGQNFTCRDGEIDIIVQKKELIAFIEVKTRKTVYFNLSEVINARKQARIIRAAHRYLCKNQTTPQVIRFDVALLTITAHNEKPTVHYIPNAFTQPESL